VTGAVIRDTSPSAFTGVTYTATQSGGGNINNTVTMPAGSKITYKATGTISASAITPVHRTTINSGIYQAQRLYEALMAPPFPVAGRWWLQPILTGWPTRTMCLRTPTRVKPRSGIRTTAFSSARVRPNSSGRLDLG
jgi:hypothetical protein